MPPRLRSYRGTSFWALPPEIRLQVWELLNEAGAPYSGYASVSRDWQRFFERLTFNTLRVHQDDIESFAEIMKKGHRIFLVRHIWLQIELLGYDCPECEHPESKTETKSNNHIFSVAVHKLLNILGQWGGRSAGGIQLELSAHSPSDWEHHFKELTYRSIEGAARPLPGSVRYHDPAHGWFNGRTDFYFPGRHGEYPCPPVRVFGPGIRFSPRSRRLCQVPVVNSFLIRRQFYRAFSITGGIERIVEALPNLEHFSYEPWAGGMWDEEIKESEYEQIHLASQLLRRKPTLKTVSIFQEFNRPLNGRCAARFPVSNWCPQFVELSVGLERAYGSFAVDAMDFFTYVDDHVQLRSALYWDKLEVLVLTSRQLRPRSPRNQKYDRLLLSAARALANMPKLRRLELWGGALGYGYLFRYMVDGEGRPTATLMSTWFCRLSPRVIKAWEDVVRGHAHEHSLEVSHVDLDPDRMKSHGTILQHLKREPHGVISDRSRDELLKESIWTNLYSL